MPRPIQVASAKWVHAPNLDRSSQLQSCITDHSAALTTVDSPSASRCQGSPLRCIPMCSCLWTVHFTVVSRLSTACRKHHEPRAHAHALAHGKRMHNEHGHGHVPCPMSMLSMSHVHVPCPKQPCSRGAFSRTADAAALRRRRMQSPLDCHDWQKPSMTKHQQKPPCIWPRPPRQCMASSQSSDAITGPADSMANPLEESAHRDLGLHLHSNSLQTSRRY